MSGRINDIYYFNYTRDIGYYDSVRDFSSLEMEFIGMAVSTEKIRVNASPQRFKIPTSVTEQIREAAISNMNLLCEISQELAENSPQYILICYADGRKIYYKYNITFCEIFNTAKRYEPQERVEHSFDVLSSTERKNLFCANCGCELTLENKYCKKCGKKVLQEKPLEKMVTTNESPYAIQRNEDTAENYILLQTSMQTASKETALKTFQQQNSTSGSTVIKEDDPFLWRKLLLVIIVSILVIFLPIIAIIEDATVDAELTPIAEPQSGTILSGTEVFDGSEITIHADSGDSCVVKLKTRSGTERISFYVRAGDTVTVGVPNEYLYVYFASGDTWYGTTNLFGSKTSYSMDDEIFDFTRYTCEYTLCPVKNGNFSETPIDAEDFK